MQKQKCWRAFDLRFEASDKLRKAIETWAKKQDQPDLPIDIRRLIEIGLGGPRGHKLLKPAAAKKAGQIMDALAQDLSKARQKSR